MADYKKMYYHLFNAVTDSINAADALKRAQQECEEMYIEGDESILDFPDK